MDRTFNRAMDNSTMLGMIIDRMDRTADSQLLFHHITTSMCHTDGVADIVSETVRAQARTAVTTEHETKRKRLGAYFDAQLAL